MLAFLVVFFCISKYDFHRVCLEFLDQIVRIAFLTILSLLIDVPGMSLHLFSFSGKYLTNILWVLVHSTYTSCIKFVPKYFVFLLMLL